MPLPAPILDDRSYQQIRDELVRRIPVYNPEWRDHNASDPGITLIELFAFLGENLLYRFNQIPEATKLAFLRLLQIPLRPATPASAIIAATTEEKSGTLVPVGVVARAGDIAFETTTELTVWPVEAVAVARLAALPPESQEDQDFAQAAIDARGGLTADEVPAYYRNVELPAEPAKPDAPVVDFSTAVDGMLWIAILKTDQTDLPAMANVLLNVGFAVDEQVRGMDEVVTEAGMAPDRGAPKVVWHASTSQIDTATGKPVYRVIPSEGDNTHGLSRTGVVRLHLPADPGELGVYQLDDPSKAGLDQFPPVLDEPKKNARVLFWLRASRARGERPLGRVLWVGINATEVVQQRRGRTEFLGTGTGQPGQTASLIHKPVVKGSLVLEVEEDKGWVPWQAVEDFWSSKEDDRHFVVDLEAGTVRFGNGLRGRAPQIGERIRANEYRYGGGPAGNVAALAISKLEPPAGSPGIGALKAANPLPARGGAPGETVAEALERVPAEFRRHDRAVTRSDFQELALATPGAEVGRAEVLALFHPPSRNQEAAGVVSVVVWPREDRRSPNAPMPNRWTLRDVRAWLNARRLVTTELWVIPPTYRKIAVAVGLKVKQGSGPDAVRHWVELVLRQYLAPLPPYGPDGHGWPLGRRVHGPELEAAALQVEGVEFIEGDLAVAWWDSAQSLWVKGSVVLQPWEVPELHEITVVEGPPLEPGTALGIPVEPVRVPPLPPLPTPPSPAAPGRVSTVPPEPGAPPIGRIPVPIPVPPKEC